MTKVYNIHFKDVPNGWALCFNDNCTQHADCLRRIAGNVAEQEPEFDHYEERLVFRF